ncbi:VOC family protein [Baekduia soli]|uniref:VOC family protein n=1 Tax=Baekduia soli TaxID=496014 RepID=A0A5B8U0G9_9ACTN|nr:VOC family protein [Baekduia soli]QEC46458.1 VOC family protein [Baekduia soli]
MTEQDRYIPGVPCWIDATEPDPEAAAAFYAGLFAWELEDVAPPEAPGRYFMARLPGGDVGAVGSQPEGAAAAATWNTYIWVQDADATAERVRAAGGRVLTEPFEVGDAGRTAVVADPEGAVFSLWQARRHRGAAVVNEPGSLNFNVLHTRDAGGAAAFYGAVFGWEPLPVGDGTAWALAGYGDVLEQRNPGMREGMAAMGAPARFEDVVASLLVMGDDEPGAAHWAVTFGVDDADAVAARATELGGRVVVAPFDAPWVRMAVLADPQGATFTASRFTPENKDL